MRSHKCTCRRSLEIVCEPPGGYRVFADDLDDLWAEPTTGRWQGGSKALSCPRIVLRQRYAV